MDSLNPYEAPSVPLSEVANGRANWLRACCVAFGYWVVAVFLFGFLPPYWRMQSGSLPHSLTFENLSCYADDKFFVVWWLASPIAIAAAVLDFAPSRRLGIIRSFAVSGGILLFIFVASEIAMTLFDESLRDTFIAGRNTYGATPTWAYWAFLVVGDLLWLTAIAFILKRRLQETPS
jgi:hypothetical protein